MKIVFLSALVLAVCTAAAFAKTATATIGETAQIVPGNNITAYLWGDDIVTRTAQTPSRKPDGVPVLRVGFDLQPTWYLVKRVIWDKHRRRLTIHF